MTVHDEPPVMLRQNRTCAICGKTGPNVLVRTTNDVCTRCAPIVIESECDQCKSDTPTHCCCGTVFDFERGDER